jgi:tetratricopeptide (TPR) repeat protein
VVELDPMNAQAHFGLARVAFHRREWERAATEAKTTIGQHFHFGPAHHLLGLALWKLGKTDEAFESLKKAVEVNPVFPLGHHSLSRFYRLVRRDAAAGIAIWPARRGSMRAGSRPQPARSIPKRFAIASALRKATTSGRHPRLPIRSPRERKR